jgi:hypothetical protein
MLHKVVVVDDAGTFQQTSTLEFQLHVEQMAGEYGWESKDCSIVTDMDEVLDSWNKIGETLVVACSSLQEVTQPVEMVAPV